MVGVSVYSVVHVMDVEVKSTGEDVLTNAKNIDPSLIEHPNNLNDIIESIQKGIGALLHIIEEFFNKGIELERVCRVAVLLIKSGVNKNNSIFHRIAKRCLVEQKNDGGWIGIEDSIWCVAFLKEFEGYSQAYKCGLNWLRKQKLENGGWGKTKRDIGRIPITGILLYLLPELSNKDSLSWLESEWKKEFDLNPKLTYKMAFILMAFNKNKYQFSDSDLFSDSLDWLISQQNEDNGFGPWKEHPGGSDSWCTGISIMGLLQYPNDIPREVILKGLEWLKENQLSNGLWPYHYIEDGSSWSLYALIRGYRSLYGGKN